MAKAPQQMDFYILCLLIYFCPISFNQQERSNSKTLIGNIFSNAIFPNIISGNITLPISDHPPQFLISPNIFLSPSSLETNI